MGDEKLVNNVPGDLYLHSTARLLADLVLLRALLVVAAPRLRPRQLHRPDLLVEERARLGRERKKGNKNQRYARPPPGLAQPPPCRSAPPLPPRENATF